MPFLLKTEEYSKYGKGRSMNNITYNKINKSVGSLVKSRLFTNMSWLFILNFSNMIIPVFTFPYITRIFLPDGYGLVSFSLSFIAYFQSFIDYGFSLTGARKIATAEGNKKELSKIYSSIIAAKFLLFLISVPLIIMITLSNTKLYECHEIIFIFIIMAFSNVVMPTWLFQGLQKVKDMTIISLLTRTIFLICVFTMVKTSEDIPTYAILYATSFLIIGVVSMIAIRTQIKIKLCKISLRDIVDVMNDGFYVFTSSAVISVMSTTGIFVLGLFYAAEYTGYYSGINKINQLVTMLFYPIGQALFPYHSKKYAESFKRGYSSSMRIAKIVIPGFTGFAVIVILFREHIVNLVVGPGYVNAANLLIIMAFLPALSIMSNFMGTQILVASGHTKEYSRAFLRGSFISIFLYFVLGYSFGTWGVAIGAFLGAVFNLLFLQVEILAIVKNPKET
jgi:PST family polysaccharide transporter